MRTTTFIEAIRKRPGMYVGDTGAMGLHHLIYFQLDAIHEEYLARRCEVVQVVLEAEGGVVSLFDDGMPIAPGDLQRIVTEAEDSFRPSRNSYLALVSALSRHLRVDVWDGTTHWTIASDRGSALSGPVEVNPAQPVPLSARSGVRVTFLPDPDIFGSVRLEPERVLKRARELAFLAPGLRMVFSLGGGAYDLRYPDGLAQRLSELVSSSSATPPEPLAFDIAWGDFHLRAALTWHRWAYELQLQSFANTVHTHKHGAHVDGVVLGLRQALGELSGLPLAKIKRKALEQNLVGFVALESPSSRLQFAGPTKNLLSIPGLETEIAEQLRPRLVTLLRESAVTAMLIKRASGEYVGL